jgi:hypothetical protein
MLPHRLKTIADFARSMWNRRAYMQCTFAPFCTVGQRGVSIRTRFNGVDVISEFHSSS